MVFVHAVIFHRRTSRKITGTGRALALMLAGALMLGAIGSFIFMRGHRKPPSIFDSPVDDVSAFLASKDFNAMSTKERMEYLQGILKRFGSMNQNDSAVAAAFFAGLSGKASEQLMNNARVLGKDILVEGAQQYLTMKTDQEKVAFIDQWIVQWVRMADQMGRVANGKESPAAGGRSDQEVLDRLSGQAKRDAQQIGAISAPMAQQLMDFWQRDVASVASPKEQGQIFLFLPAVRDRLIQRSKPFS
jgi:hypothetical protein